MSEIRHLRRGRIDEARWNAAVEADPSRLGYGLTWWLDAVTNGRWTGLVLGDYRAVLPLPHWGKPLSSLLILRAPFTQQNGPFGASVNPNDLAQFLQAIPSYYVYRDLPLLARYAADEVPDTWQVTERTNLVIPLGRPYADIQAAYTSQRRRYLRRWQGGSLQTASPDLAIQLFRESGGKKAGLVEKHYRRLRALVTACLQRGLGQCWQYCSAEGELLAASFFPNYRGRIINLFSGSTPLGYDRHGMAYLIDALLQQEAERAQLFDFEGSDIPGIQNFFSRFGPDRRNYLRIQNRIL